ncbi:GerMN domain-containing protein [Aristaeella lactis]|uniref:Sporulation and spore germination n=1 Tax=Aristaeella lactis TaxID=3046383 RepID=A0AC61PMA8_9FIRM|nr:GerMN domain-containing protein [Aristaeella lactis]QUA53110.1 GerMN domain-containing protein [Aristaeella lactis]SMC67692.1 Sporulation and spore germination [Aristaeella lactis]
MKRRVISLLTAFCLLFLLTGCTDSSMEEKHAPAPTLPPAEDRYHAPDGDESLGINREYRMFFPRTDGLYLVSRTTEVDGENLLDTVEHLLLNLFAFKGDTEALKIGGNKPVGLYGTHPVEISGGVCTVNLSASILDQLRKEKVYKDYLAITATLCELDEISYVNFLIAGLSHEMTGNMPLGTFVGQPDKNIQGFNIQTAWEQMEAKRTPTGMDAAKIPLKTPATLYYPLPDGRGVGCTIREVSFAGQTQAQLVTGLIDTVSTVLKSMPEGQNIPELKSLLLRDPLVIDREDGTQQLVLSLREDAEERLREGKTDPACYEAAMIYMLTTFVPNIRYVSFRVGNQNQLVTELKETEHFSAVTALGGLFSRDVVEPFLKGSITVYFARNGILCECEQPITRRAADSPRAQLCVVMEGPDATERENGVTATLPEGIREDDILGISAEGDTLLVNLSENFREAILENGADNEMLLCYSMVNTLCKNTGMKRVRFYFEGRQEEHIAGTIYWAGEFMYNIGLAEKGLG